MRKRRLLSEQAIEQRARYIEEILQPEMIAASEALAKAQEKRISFFAVNSVFCLLLPENIGLMPEESPEPHFLLRLAAKTLEIWLDPKDERMISIGDNDYCLGREGKLIELDAIALLPRRKPKSKDYQLAQNTEGRFILDLRVIEGNEKIVQFFAK